MRAHPSDSTFHLPNGVRVLVPPFISAGERIISFVLRFAAAKVRGKVDAILRRFIEGLESLRSPGAEGSFTLVK